MMRSMLLERVELGWIYDHSGWARSVRWSCGRPGYTPTFDLGGTAARDLAIERARHWVALSITRPDTDFRVTTV